jgi:hypothetical protein
MFFYICQDGFYGPQLGLSGECVMWPLEEKIGPIV